MVTIVERTESDELHKLFKEGNEHGVGELMKDIWFTDKKRPSQKFANDQAVNGSIKIIDMFLLCYYSNWQQR